MSAIDEVKQKIDIVEVVGRYTQLTKSGRNFRALCPFHNEKTPSFFVFPERQSWHCFGACSTGGDAFAFVMRKEGIDFGEALRRLADSAGVVLPSRIEVEGKKEARDRLYQANQAASAYFHDLLVNSRAGEKALGYLTGRGLSRNSIGEFRLGYALDSWDGLKKHLSERGYSEKEMLDAGLLSSGENGRIYDRWRNRLMIPIRDEKGQTTGFGARVLDDSFPKYINSPQTLVFDKSATLYGLDLAAAAIRQQDLSVIVEGYMDVIAAHQFGFNNVIASMGTSITDRQINRLKRLSHNLVLALDSDSAGEEAMLRCVGHENTLEAEIKVMILPEGKDPDDVIKADAEEWRRLVADASPVIDYTFDRVAAGLDLTKVKDRTQARDRLFPIVDGITDVVRRAHYLQKLARMVGVSESNLESAMRKVKAGSKRAAGLKNEAAATSNADRLFSSPTEEYCLTLLLRHPELKEDGQKLPPEYFENSENREVFVCWRDEGDVESLKATAEIAVLEHLERVLNKSIPEGSIELKYADCVLNLRKTFLRNLAKKREAFFSLGGENGNAAAARPEEQDIKIKNELMAVFDQKARREQRLRS